MNLPVSAFGSYDNVLGRQFVYMAMMEESTHLVKIGHSLDPMEREASLFSAGVVAPYHMLHAWEVADMVWVEEQVIHPALAPYRNLYNKEIFDLFMAYPNLIDHSTADVVNGLTIANKLADDITALLQKRGIEARRWSLDGLAHYHKMVRESKNPKGK
jgi:hypothetical protein